MKKLLLVLLVVTLSSFLFVGCLGTGTVVDDEDTDGDGTVVTTVVEVDIADSVELGGKLYVSADTHDITVTFPAPVVGNVVAYLGSCSGDYPVKGIVDDLLLLMGDTIAMFPNADRTEWEGSADFELAGGPCCATYIFISAGECEDEACIQFPVIVDACPPYALIEWEVDDCPCDGCAVTFTSTTDEEDCEDAVECCGDDCSGLASWSFKIYEDDPFDKCCDPSICEEEIDSGSGICPIDFTTECLIGDVDGGVIYWVVIELVDEVGLETTYYAQVEVFDGAADDDCAILVYPGTELVGPPCVDFTGATADTIGLCESDCENGE